MKARFAIRDGRVELAVLLAHACHSGTPLLMFGYLREGAAGVRVHAAQYRCVSRVDAYNDVHWNGSPINGRQDTCWSLQPAFLMSTASGWSLRRFGGGRTSSR